MTTIRMNFTTISVIKEQIAVGRRINIVALVVKLHPPIQQKTRSGTSQQMRKIILADDKSCEIELAIWGGEVGDRDIPLHSVIAVRDVMVRDFQRQKTLSCLWSQIQFNPRVSLVASKLTELVEWYLAKDSLLLDDSKPVTEITEKVAEGRKVDESIRSVAITSIGCNSDSGAITTPTKRANPYHEDNPDVAKRRKIEQSLHTSATDSSKPSSTVTSLQSMEASSSRLNFETSSTIKERVAVGKQTDIIGFVVTLQPVTQIQTKSGTSLWMRKLILADDKSCEMELAIWGGDVKNHDFPLQSVIVAKDARVQDFQGAKTLSCLWSQIRIDPNVPQAALLRQFASNYVRGVLEGSAGHSDLPDNFTPIREIKTVSPSGSLCNIVGLVINCEEPELRQMKSGNESWIKPVTVTDDKGNDIALTVWCGDVMERDIPLFSVITAKNVMINNFFGVKTLSCWWTNLNIDPDVQQAVQLRKRIPEFLDEPLSSSDSSASSYFTPFLKIKRAKPRSKCNIAGLVVGCEPVQAIRRGDKSLRPEQEVTVADAKNSEMRLIVRDSMVDDIQLHSVITASNVYVREVQGTKILCCWRENVQINPSIEEAVKLKELIAHYSAKEETRNSVVVKSPAVESPRRSGSSLGINYMRIEEVKTAPSGSHHDIAVLVVKSKPPEERQTKAGNKTWIRIVTVADAKYSEMEMTVWGIDVSVHDIPIHSVITANVMVRKLDSDTTLSCLWSKLQMNPDIPQSTALKKLIPHYSAISETAKAAVAGSSGNVVCPMHESERSSFINFSTISKIKNEATVGSTYDIAGRIIKNGSTGELQKSGKQLRYCILTIADDEDCDIEIMVWAKETQKVQLPLHFMITAKHFKVRSLNEKKMLTGPLANVTVHLDIPRSECLEKRIARHSAINKSNDIPVAGPSRIVTDASSSRQINRYEGIVFTPIEEIKANVTKGSKYDVIGVLGEAGVPRLVPSEIGEDSWFIAVKLEDGDGNCIDLFVRCPILPKCRIPSNVVLAARDATVENVEGKLELCTYWSKVAIDPDIPAARKLKGCVAMQMISSGRRCVGLDDQITYFDPIEVIKRLNITTDNISTFGLVVEVNPPERHETLLVTMDVVRKCVLRGRNRAEIEVHIMLDSSNPFDIPIHSVIVVSRATLHLNDEKKRVLICSYVDVLCDIIIPETEGLKEAVLNAPEVPTVEHLNDFTAIKQIKEETTPGIAINIIGLVVDVLQPISSRRAAKKWFENYTVRVTLRDMDSQMIDLVIKENCRVDYEIKINYVLSARDATLKLVGDDKVLWCRRINVTLEPEVPERNNLKKLKNIPVAKRLTPLTDIKQNSWMDGCMINIVGRVVSMSSIIRSRRMPYIDLEVQNRIKMNLRVYGIEPHAENAIPMNATIAVRTLLTTSNKIYPLTAFWKDVKVNPKIPAVPRLRKCKRYCVLKKRLKKAQKFRVVPIARVLEDLPHNAVASIMGILINSEVRETNDRSLSRLIQVIGGGKKIINLLMHDSAARNFKACLNSVIMVKNFRVSRLTRNDVKIGICNRQTEFIVNPSDDKYRKVTERLKIWFARNSTNISAEAFSAMENNPVIPAAGDTADATDIEMAERSEKMKEVTISLREDAASTEDERILDDLNLEHEDSSPDIFADC